MNEAQHPLGEQVHSPPLKRNVVLGMASGYRWGDLRNFVVSLRHSKFTVRKATRLWMRNVVQTDSSLHVLRVG
jgi:hypothetical protein